MTTIRLIYDAGLDWGSLDKYDMILFNLDQCIFGFLITVIHFGSVKKTYERDYKIKREYIISG